MINGIINVYKEKGYTSHDVVACLRKIVGQKKIGHTGTLDPDAEGVLPVCLGRATKVCGMLTDTDKIYETVLLLGRTTDTQDISGSTLEEKNTQGLCEEDVRKCIRSFEGKYDQVPPMYSALKVNGRKLYELAREGKTVERKSRQVMIRRIKIKEIDLPRIRMEVECSKGTYIRTLCNDIGEKAGVGGCMESLLRTRVGRFRIEHSFRLSEIETAVNENKLDSILVPLDEMFSEMDKSTVTEEAALLAYNGNPLEKNQVIIGTEVQDGQAFRMYDNAGHFIGIYRYEAEKRQFRIEKMFLDREILML